jgi:hypothetical protein
VHEPHESIARDRILKVRMLRRGRCVLRPVEGIDHQNRIAGLRQALAHLPECRPQPEDVRPDEHAGMGSLGRMDEVGIRCAIGRVDFDLGLRHRHVGSTGGRYKQRGETGPRSQGGELPSGKAPRA